MSGGGSGSQSGRSIADQGTEVIGQAQEQAGKLIDTARQQATSQITSQFATQQQRLAGTLNTVATALHDASREMRSQDETQIAEYVDSAASQVEHLANTLREQDLQQLMNTTTQFARRQPALFLGATFALGFAATRFLKSSSQSGGQERSADAGKWYDGAGGMSDLGYSGGRLSTERMGYSGGMGASGTMESSRSDSASGSAGPSSSARTGSTTGSGSQSGSSTGDDLAAST